MALPAPPPPLPPLPQVAYPPWAPWRAQWLMARAVLAARRARRLPDSWTTAVPVEFQGRHYIAIVDQATWDVCVARVLQSERIGERVRLLRRTPWPVVFLARIALQQRTSASLPDLAEIAGRNMTDGRLQRHER
jgi:hypothetical protein